MANIQSNSGGGPNNAKNHTSSVVTVSASKGVDELNLGSAVFHDFLGNTPTGNVRPPSEASSGGGGAGGGGGRGPISTTTSDLRSDRHSAGNHIEGVPCYGPRSDFMCHERPNVFVGMKRNNSHCYGATSADRFPAGRLDSLEGTELIKLLRNVGGDRLRRPSMEDSSFPLHLHRPTSDSLISQPSSGLRTDPNASKWDSFNPMNAGPVRQYPPRSGHVVPFGQLSGPNKLNESNAGQLFTQCAADEGSRTGIKGSGFLNPIKESGNFSGILASSGKPNSCGNISEPESSLSNSQHGSASAGCQMTIFYNGQAHVFDSVHPNKAHIIMALAGSNGESWSTAYSPKSTATARKSTGENHGSWRKNDAGVAGSFAAKPGVHGKSFTRVNSSRGFNISQEKNNVVLTGTHLEGMTEKDLKNSSHHATDDVLADK